jgi:hypothetical protein
MGIADDAEKPPTSESAALEVPGASAERTDMLLFRDILAAFKSDDCSTQLQGTSELRA